MSGEKQGGIVSIGSRVSQWILDCLFPKICLECGAEGDYRCVSCCAKPFQLYPPHCFGCGKAGLRGRLCADCSPRFAFDGLIIAADYESEPLKTMIRYCKYRFVKDLIPQLARYMYRAITETIAVDDSESELMNNFFQVTVCAIPLSRKRRRWRGFNQAELLADEVAGYCGLSRLDMLSRTHRKAQAKLNEAERLHNLKGSFKVSGEVPRFVILVDDVVTTGATLNEAAKVLKRAGADEVWGIVVAKG